MKKQLKKWALRLTALALLIIGLLLVIVLNPVLTYANKTGHNNFTIFHNKAIEPILLTRLDKANELIKTSEFYNPELKLDICLNDGSNYPKLIRALHGRAFAWGFYDKVVLQGTLNSKDNYVELNGYRWNLTQLLAHEMTHCLQFDKLGLWKSNPVAKIPDWKWEGYAEYISRQSNDLLKNIARLNNTGKNPWEVTLEDSTIAPKNYYEYWVLVQYCMDIKRMTYKQLLTDTTSERTVRQEMMRWFSNGQ